MKRPWTGQISITAEMAAALLADQFPQLTPVQAVFLDEGWDNIVFRVNETFIFRFPRRPIALDCMDAENRVLPLLEPLLSLPVPRPALFGMPSDLYPYPFTGYAMLPGRAAHAANLSAVQRNRAAEPLAQFLKTLHHVPTERAIRMGAEPDRMGRLDLERRLPIFEEYAEEAVRRGLWNSVSPFMRVIREMPRAKTPQTRTVLVHGDLNFRNVLVDAEGTLSGVIDWGDVHIGHPAMDIAMAHSFLPPDGREIFRRTYGDLDDETWNIARFRALYMNLYLLVYAHDIDDALQLREAKTALELALS